MPHSAGILKDDLIKRICDVMIGEANDISECLISLIEDERDEDDFNCELITVSNKLFYCPIMHSALVHNVDIFFAGLIVCSAVINIKKAMI